ncbi:hypothetical protein J2I48_02370 [Fibrella sp. HMF5036]|uniref:Uncharacterized protein n=1 Tax=Fibrella aquatilis TaxID=2817059 RepID=A0A939JZ53_9BACT|nr:hypothetical protein [Fibrella aquatilis]
MSLLACGKKTVDPSVADKVKRVWTAQSVKENATVVYTKGGASNVRNYSPYRLDLSSPPAVSFTDYDGITVNGQYAVPSDTRLVLSGLTPAPTGTGGTIEFTINASTDTQITLTRVTASPKTGNSTNQYVLINP